MAWYWWLAMGLPIGSVFGAFLMGLVVQRKIAEQRDITFKLGRELGTGEGYKLRDKELRQAYSARGKKGWETKRARDGWSA